MKILTSLIAGCALMLGMAFAQDAPKPAAPAAAPVTKETKAKKHRKHKKTVKPAAATAAPATTVAPANVAPKK